MTVDLERPEYLERDMYQMNKRNADSLYQLDSATPRQETESNQRKR